MNTSELAWNLFTELRRETIESHRIRAQVIGFKITFVSASAGLLVANRATVPLWLMLVPAFAAVFFDVLIANYNFGIWRVSNYLRCYVEPKLRKEASWPQLDPLWEEHVSLRENKRYLALVGNLGITLLVSIPAVALVTSAFGFFRAAIPSLALIALLIYDFYCYFIPFRMAECPPLPKDGTH